MSFAIKIGGCTVKWLRNGKFTLMMVLGVLISLLFLGIAVAEAWKWIYLR